MNKFSFLSLMLLMCFFVNCKKKPCNTTYTVSGQILNGTTGKKYYNVEISFIASDGDFNSGKKATTYKDLGKTRTDSFGNFTFSYQCSDFPGKQISMTSDLMDLGYIPFNQNYKNTWYRSTFGTLKLVLKTSNLMTSSDTLFLWHRDIVLNKSIIDTLRNLPLEYEILYRVPPGNIGFYYGRGHKEFKYNFQKDGVQYSKGSGDVNIYGDPNIDSLILNY